MNLPADPLLQDPDQERVVEEDIRKWVEMYEARAKKHSELATVAKFLTDFYQFSLSYVRYVEDVLEKIIDADNTHEQYVRFMAMKVVRDEWAHICRLLDQRELYRYENWLHGREEQAREYMPANAPGILAYLGDAAAIRHQPYSSITVASIPRQQYKDGDGMALPHEVGHHVWRFVRDNSATYEIASGIRECVQDLWANNDVTVTASRGEQEIEDPDIVTGMLADLMEAWFEESFADVYGAYVAGADNVKSLIRLNKKRIGKAQDLLRDDGIHPLPYLRPFGRIKVLELLGLSEEADTWRRQWEEVITFDVAVQGKHYAMALDPDRKVTFAVAVDRVNGTDLEHDNGRPDSIPVGHEHGLGEITLTLKHTRTILEAVVERVIFPIVADVYSNGLPRSMPDYTFDTFKERIEKQGDNGFKFLLRPLSTRLYAETRHIGSKFHGHGKTGTHQHQDWWHTHNKDGSVT